MADTSYRKTRARCKAIITYGSVWDCGRKQCSKPAVDGEDFCHVHLQQAQRRAAMRERLEAAKNRAPDA